MQDHAAALHVTAMDTQETLTAPVGVHTMDMPEDTRQAMMDALEAVQAFRALTFRDWLGTVRPFDAAQD
jgi:hypothetical protein